MIQRYQLPRYSLHIKIINIPRLQFTINPPKTHLQQLRKISTQPSYRQTIQPITIQTQSLQLAHCTNINQSIISNRCTP